MYVWLSPCAIQPETNSSTPIQNKKFRIKKKSPVFLKMHYEAQKIILERTGKFGPQSERLCKGC